MHSLHRLSNSKFSDFSANRSKLSEKCKQHTHIKNYTIIENINELSAT